MRQPFKPSMWVTFLSFASVVALVAASSKSPLRGSPTGNYDKFSQEPSLQQQDRLLQGERGGASATSCVVDESASQSGGVANARLAVIEYYFAVESSEPAGVSIIRDIESKLFGLVQDVSDLCGEQRNRNLKQTSTNRELQHDLDTRHLLQEEARRLTFLTISSGPYNAVDSECTYDFQAEECIVFFGQVTILAKHSDDEEFHEARESIMELIEHAMDTDRLLDNSLYPTVSRVEWIGASLDDFQLAWKLTPTQDENDSSEESGVDENSSVDEDNQSQSVDATNRDIITSDRGDTDNLSESKSGDRFSAGLIFVVSFLPITFITGLGLYMLKKRDEADVVAGPFDEYRTNIGTGDPPKSYHDGEYHYTVDGVQFLSTNCDYCYGTRMNAFLISPAMSTIEINICREDPTTTIFSPRIKIIQQDNLMLRAGLLAPSYRDDRLPAVELVSEMSESPMSRGSRRYVRTPNSRRHTVSFDADTRLVHDDDKHASPRNCELVERAGRVGNRSRATAGNSCPSEGSSDAEENEIFVFDDSPTSSCDQTRKNFVETAANTSPTSMEGFSVLTTKSSCDRVEESRPLILESLQSQRDTTMGNQEHTRLPIPVKTKDNKERLLLSGTVDSDDMYLAPGFISAYSDIVDPHGEQTSITPQIAMLSLQSSTSKESNYDGIEVDTVSNADADISLQGNNGTRSHTFQVRDVELPCDDVIEIGRNISGLSEGSNSPQSTDGSQPWAHHFAKPSFDSSTSSSLGSFINSASLPSPQAAFGTDGTNLPQYFPSLLMASSSSDSEDSTITDSSRTSELANIELGIATKDKEA